MLLYEDVLTGDEMFSDAFPMCVDSWLLLVLKLIACRWDSKLVDDIVYEVDCQTITVKEGDVDIGAPD